MKKMLEEIGDVKIIETDSTEYSNFSKSSWTEFRIDYFKMIWTEIYIAQKKFDRVNFKLCTITSKIFLYLYILTSASLQNTCINILVHSFLSDQKKIFLLRYF